MHGETATTTASAVWRAGAPKAPGETGAERRAEQDKQAMPGEASVGGAGVLKAPGETGADRRAELEKQAMPGETSLDGRAEGR